MTRRSTPIPELRSPTHSLSMVMINLGDVITYRTILFLVGVNPRPMCLAHLLVTGNLIKSAILAECSSGLLEVERHIGLDALFSDFEHPVIVTNTGIVSRLAAYGYLLDTGAKFITYGIRATDSTFDSFPIITFSK